MKVEVDAQLLRAGAEMTSDAGRLVAGGADRLDQARLPRGMFGDFAGAHAFQSLATDRHAESVAVLHAHGSVLADVSAKAHAAACVFVATDDANANLIGAVDEVDL